MQVGLYGSVLFLLIDLFVASMFGVYGFWNFLKLHVSFKNIYMYEMYQLGDFFGDGGQYICAYCDTQSACS